MTIRRQTIAMVAVMTRHIMQAMMALLLYALIAAGSASAQPVQTAAVQAPPAPARAQVLAARLGEHPDKTRFVLELSQATAFRVETHTTPHSILIDLADAAWEGGIMPGRGLVAAIASEPVAGDRLRLVLAAVGPVRVVAAEMIPPRDGYGPRFFLDLAAVNGTHAAADLRPLGTLAALGGLPRPPADVAAMATGPQPSPAGPVSAAPPSAAVVAAATTSPPAPPKPKPKSTAPRLPLIVIDAGHGGQDPGAIAVDGTFEKDITLAVAVELRRQLLATGRYRVILTRDKDVFLPLRARAAVARDNDADLFISLHSDSIATPGIRGLSIYTLSDKASDREAEALAQRENRADRLGGVDLSSQSADIATILIGLSQREKMNQSRRFAQLVLAHLDPSITKLRSPLRSAGFGVLTAPDVPSVLVEMGYLSHAQDIKLLKSDAYRKRLSASLVRAINGYFSPSAGRARS